MYLEHNQSFMYSRLSYRLPHSLALIVTTQQHYQARNNRKGLVIGCPEGDFYLGAFYKALLPQLVTLINYRGQLKPSIV